MQTRREKLLASLDLQKQVGAEIGPLHNPLIRREDGHVIYIDHKCAEDLRKSYANDPNVQPESIQVDAIWGGHTLQQAIAEYFQNTDGSLRALDYVVASHVIEHVPDLVTWLQEIRSVLTPVGEVRLAIPDKRFTFDYLRSPTQLADVLAAYVARARIPNTHCLLDFCLNEVAVDTVAAWQGKLNVAELKKAHTVEGALWVARDALMNGSYHDVHCWVFTPCSFANLLVELAQADLIDFACAEFYEPEPNTNEFIVNLRVCEDKAAVLNSWKHMAELAEAAERKTEKTIAEQTTQQDPAQLDQVSRCDHAETAEQAQRVVDAANASAKRSITGLRSAWNAVKATIKG